MIACIIFTSDFNIGVNKLLEIEEEKKKNGIVCTNKKLSKTQLCLNGMKFTDGEVWRIVNPKYNNTSRGYRWKKAWVDASNTTISELNNIIKPTGIYKVEDEKYFN